MIFYLLLLFLLLGSMLIFYSLSPYYAAVGLVITAFFGCMLLGFMGLTFMALLFFLIYMGGMLVVFIYSSALSADRFPQVSNLEDVLILFCLVLMWVYSIYDPFMESKLLMGSFKLQLDLNSLSVLYKEGGVYFLMGGLALLIVLMVVLMLSLGETFSSLRSI